MYNMWMFKMGWMERCIILFTIIFKNKVYDTGDLKGCRKNGLPKNMVNSPNPRKTNEKEKQTNLPIVIFLKGMIYVRRFSKM